MNKKLKVLGRVLTAVLCITGLLLKETPVLYADETVESLEQQTEGLQKELDDLNQELGSLSKEITELAEKLEETKAAVEKAELDLAAAQLAERLQYDAMKMRIKYMYEAGDYNVFEVLFASENMGDLLNRAEYVKDVAEYDRTMMEELQRIHEEVQAKKQALEDEQAQQEAMQTELEEREQQLNDKISSTTSELQASEEELQAAREAQAAAEAALRARQEAMAASATPGSGVQQSGSAMQVETDELVLFAAILQCEAGTSSYDALLAVATVVMNRVESGQYPNTISGVVYQSGQFSPTWNGSLNRVLSNGPVSLCYQVAQDALDGARYEPVKNCYEFRASFTGRKGIYVGDNVFF